MPSSAALLLIAPFFAVGNLACDRAPSAPTADSPDVASTEDRPLFRDATLETGLDFVHFNGMTGRYYFAETMGAGGALFDFDNDGDLDLYLLQGTLLDPQASSSDATFPPTGRALGDRLLRNDLETTENGLSSVRFADVTDEGGLVTPGHRGYGMGVAAGDYDNDGWVDLYVTRFGANALLRNLGDGTFLDVTGESGTSELRWSVPAVFFDYDRDGWLDLYVGNYVDFAVATSSPCFSDLGERDYCGPLSYRPVPDRLFRNLGDGTFEDVSGRSGLSAARTSGSGLGGALGAVSADFDGDGWLDLYVGNDGLPNHLWRNRADGTFENTALAAGSAVNADGNAEATMGIAVADAGFDGDEDLFLTHLDGESNTLYENLGNGIFDELSGAGGLGAPSLAFTGFGAVWRDLDHDGLRDVVVLNGAVSVLPELLLAGDPYPLRQINHLYRGRGQDVYELVPRPASGPFSGSDVSRAAVAGDLDNDGDLDLVVTNNSGPALVWINTTAEAELSTSTGEEPKPQWLGLRLVQANSKPSAPRTLRDALGARVEIALDDGRILTDRVRTEGGYASANDPRLLFTLRNAEQTRGPSRVQRIRIEWPDGSTELWPATQLGAYTTLEQGSAP